jgi:hypothetical protein
MFPSQFSEPNFECIDWNRCRWSIDFYKRIQEDISEESVEYKETKQKLILYNCGKPIGTMVYCCGSDKVSLDETQVFTTPKPTTTATATTSTATTSTATTSTTTSTTTRPSRPKRRMAVKSTATEPTG